MITKTSLYPYQQTAYKKIAPLKAGGLLMEMGLGKTRTIIEVARHKFERGKIDRVVYICPVSLKLTVEHELLKHTTLSADEIYRFTQKTTYETMPKTAKWYIIGTQSMSASDNQVICANELIDGRTMVVLDESHYIKTHNSIRTKRITHIAKKAQCRYILTGTSITQHIVDLYAQMKFLSPKILGYNSFYSFQNNHIEYDPDIPQRIIRCLNTGWIAGKIAPYIYQVTKDEVLDLPDKRSKQIYFEMSDEQQDLYEQTKHDILYSMLDEDNDWTGATILQLFTKLQQVVSGFIHHENGTTEVQHGRLDTLVDAINTIPDGEKVLVWCKYRHSIHAITKRLEQEYGRGCVAQYYGDLNETKRADQLERFRSSSRFFVSTQATGGHGLTLNESAHVIFYENEFKYAHRLQAEDRNHRIGQERPVLYIDIVCDAKIDRRIIESQAEKANLIERFTQKVDTIKDLEGDEFRSAVLRMI